MFFDAGTGLSLANDRDITFRRGVNYRQQLRHERNQLGQPVCPCLKDEHGDRKGREVLLECQVSVDRHKDIELLRRKREQFPFLMVDQPIWRAVLTS
jgi:hypothetical protein